MNPVQPFPRRLVALLSLAVWVLSVPTALPAQKFSDTASVVVIEIPVTVTVKDEPVRTLTEADFEVFDGRQKLDIVGFERIDLAERKAGAGKNTPIPTAGRRHFLFLFDLAFSEASSLVKAREAAKELVEKGLHPEDLAGVATYSSIQGPRILLGFTPDRAQLLLALDTLGDPKLTKRAKDPLNFVIGEATPSFVGGGSAGGAGAGAARADAVADYVASLGALQASTQKQEKENRISNMTAGMSQLARLLNSVEGRKQVIYLSEGFDETLLVGRGAGASNIPPPPGASDLSGGATTGGTDADAIASGEIGNLDTDNVYGSGKVVNVMQAMLQEFERANCSIQAVDIGGLRTSSGSDDKFSSGSVLSMMASETGGSVYRNFNDLTAAMDELLKKTSVTYLLAVQPESLKADGKFHRLRVKLKESSRGTEISHRSGFYAPVPLKKQSDTERQLRAASQIMSEAGGSLNLAVVSAPMRPPSGKVYTPVLVELDGPSLLGNAPPDTLPIEIFAYALDANGGVADFFAHFLPLNLKQSSQAIRQSGLKYYGHLDLNPGEYTLRVLVRDIETGRSSLVIQPIHAPDFSQAEMALGKALIPEPMGKWLMVREGQERQRDVPFPFLLRDQPFLPAAQSVLPANGTQTLAVSAFNVPAGDVSFKVRLLREDDTEVAGFKVAKIERFAAATEGASSFVVEAKTSNVSAGSYQIEVELIDPASGKKAVSRTAVSVAKG